MCELTDCLVVDMMLSLDHWLLLELVDLFAIVYGRCQILNCQSKDFD
jgi:hypothetical protein